MTIPYAIPWERDIHTRVHVSRPDGFTWEDLLPFTTSIEITSGSVKRFGGKITGIDGVMPQLDLVLRQDLDNRLTPQDQNSSWNQFGGEYSPLLDSMREIMIAAAITAPGISPAQSDWIGLFHGYLGDRIRTEAEGDRIMITCRSLSARLQSTYIENPKEYGSETGTPLEDVIQEVLDDNLGIGEVELYCPQPTGFMVYPYSAENVQYKMVWDVIQALASAHDFYLGDRWDPITQTFRLTLLVPPRDKNGATADFALHYRSDFYREEREIRATDVRNVIIGHYWDAAAGERRRIEVKDDASIQKNGRIAMEVEEDATSSIQTKAEMYALLNAMLSDLKDQQGTTYLGLPFFPQLDLFSGLVIHHPAMSSTDDFMGVESYRHRLDFAGKQFRTEVVGSGRIRGGQQRWLKSETRPGSPGQPGKPITSNVPPANVAWGHCTFITDVSLAWEPVAGAAAYEIRTDENWGYSDGIIYRGNGLSHRFASTKRNYTLYIKAISAAGLYSEQGTELNLSLPVPQSPQLPHIVPYFTALQIYPALLQHPAILGYYVYLTPEGESEADKRLVRAGEHLTYPALSGAQFTVQVSAFDVLGEGDKSAPMQAATTYIDENDIPDELIKARHLESLAVTTKLLQAEIAYLDEANVWKLRADKITVGGGHPGLVSTKPANSHLWHFDNSLQSTQGLSPATGSATLMEAGQFGRGVLVGSALTYQTGAGPESTVAVYKDTATWQDYANQTWTELDAL